MILAKGNLEEDKVEYKYSITRARLIGVLSAPRFIAKGKYFQLLEAGDH